MKETYCLEDTLYNTKRYFTIENGVVSGTELAQEDFNVFLDLASRLGYKVVKLFKFRKPLIRLQRLSIQSSGAD